MDEIDFNRNLSRGPHLGEGTRLVIWRAKPYIGKLLVTMKSWKGMFLTENGQGMPHFGVGTLPKRANVSQLSIVSMLTKVLQINK